ncbi:retron system putative HNH endonuclease [Aeromonas veronii]
MTIKKYTFKLKFPKKYIRFIKHIKPLTGSEWDCKAADFRNNYHGIGADRDRLKSIIKKQLEKLQGNECAFCGLDLETRVSQIEHIAPKGAKLYPQFTFEKNNLILACSLCNGFEKKGTANTITTLDKVNYKNCAFKIIHPYFDNPDDHLEYEEDNGLRFLIRAKSDKGVNTIELFELDSVAMTKERYKDALAAKEKLSPDFEQLIKDTRSRNYSTR